MNYESSTTGDRLRISLFGGGGGGGMGVGDGG